MTILENRHHSNRVPVYASTFSSDKEVYRRSIRKLEILDKKRTIAQVNGRNINYAWLKGASETYNISPDVKDYLWTECGIVTCGIPNRNMHCFPYEEVTYFDPRFGNFVYNTFVGKPTYADHKNKVPGDAKGIHFDAAIRKVPGWDIWKIYVLLGYDRTKDSALVKQIERGQRRAYSMGCWVSYFLNSITGQISNASQAAKYPKGTVHDGVLSFDQCVGCEFFECLVGGTQVLTSKGSVPIESVQIGDMVFDEFGKHIKVKRIFQNGHKTVADLTLSDGTVLASCTEEHRWQIEDGSVKKVKDFSASEKVTVIKNGICQHVTVSYGNNSRVEPTYDIHVDSNTNLYLLANGAVTHNTSSVEGPADVTAESHQLWYF